MAYCAEGAEEDGMREDEQQGKKYEKDNGCGEGDECGSTLFEGWAAGEGGEHSRGVKDAEGDKACEYMG